MKSFKTLLLMMCLAVTVTAWAESINENQARNIAARFMASHAMPSATIKMASKAPRMNAKAGTDQAAYYVFNGGSCGFVIVAGDDSAPAVLGYSDQGAFDEQNVPEALQFLLEGYAAQIDAIARGAKAETQLRSSGAIKPLLTSSWSQNDPYNNLLPIIPSSKHAYTGCVATALSQVMYYWKWPASTTQPIPAYTSSYPAANMQYYMSELPVVEFDWNAMQDTYETNDNESAGAQAVATLNLYCAQALEMTFMMYSSGANSGLIPEKAAAYFDYDAAAHKVSRGNYSTQGWADLLYGELAAGRPVIYSGSKLTGGHSFICDGYDGNGMFHMNWGWDGNSNGYYLLNVLNPSEQGAGSSDGPYGYIYTQEAIVGFQPNQGGSPVFELTADGVKLDSFVGTRGGTNEAFKVYVSGNFVNNTPNTLDVSIGWGLFDEDGVMINRLQGSNGQGLGPGYFFIHTNRELRFGAGMTSGTYRIMPIYSELGANNWRPCVGAERNYIEVTIDGNQCSVTGYGTAGTRDYTVNDVAFTGTMNQDRPVGIDVNMTNNGTSSNEMLYMFINGASAASGFVGLEPGETGDVHYSYTFANAGSYSLTWSLNENGSDPVATRTITINPMPAANLRAMVNVLDAEGSNINSDKFSVVLTITNNGSTTYDEDITANLYKHTYGNSGAGVQTVDKHLTLAAGETATLQIDMDNVIDGWQYFAFFYYYSEGTKKSLGNTYTYTVVFPEAPQGLMGDVNGNGVIEIADVTALIDYVLVGDATGINLAVADLDGDNLVGIADVTLLIDMILSGSANN